MRPLVLASSSPYRRDLLQKLGMPFECCSPDIDESAIDGELPAILVARLAQQKARALRARFPEGWIIGSDQVACLDGAILGKPGNLASATKQLRRCSGRRVEFLTGLSLLDARSGVAETIVEPFTVVFRELTEAQIRHYLEREAPFDCVGSFKAEGLGIALFEGMEGTDFNALVGLPLIRLVSLLQQAGIAVI